MDKIKKKKKKGRSLTSMARERLIDSDLHGSGKNDPTQGMKAAGPGAKIYQVG